MQIHPTRPTIQVAFAGALFLVAGAILRRPDLAAFGGAMVVAVAAFRTAALATVARIRGAGFEMVWLGDERVVHLRRGETKIIGCEIRNRGNVDARGVALRVLASPGLSATLVAPGEDVQDARKSVQDASNADVDGSANGTSLSVELLASSRLRLDLRLTAKRVGRFGVHGITVDVRGIPIGGDALYEAPLMFANPLGVEVVAAPSRRTFGRSGGASASAGRRAHARRLGRGDELRELREHVPGDAFKRIAWKPSARRGKLLVRETDDEQNTVLWVVIDASSEYWNGALGDAPLDHAFDRAQGLAFAALDRGEAVGFVVVTGAGVNFLVPGHGERQKARIERAVVDASALGSAARSSLDEEGVALYAAEHLRPLDGLSGRRASLAELVARVEGVKGRAPFDVPMPEGRTTTDARLRKHLLDFGVGLPPRAEGEARVTEPLLLEALARVERLPRGEVHLFVPPSSSLRKVVGGLRRGRTRVVVNLYDTHLSGDATSPFERAVRRAVEWRAGELLQRCQRELRASGVRVKVLSPQQEVRGG